MIDKNLCHVSSFLSDPTAKLASMLGHARIARIDQLLAAEGLSILRRTTGARVWLLL